MLSFLDNTHIDVWLVHIGQFMSVVSLWKSSGYWKDRYQKMHQQTALHGKTVKKLHKYIKTLRPLGYRIQIVQTYGTHKSQFVDIVSDHEENNMIWQPCNPNGLYFEDALKSGFVQPEAFIYLVIHAFLGSIFKIPQISCMRTE